MNTKLKKTLFIFALIFSVAIMFKPAVIAEASLSISGDVDLNRSGDEFAIKLAGGISDDYCNAPHYYWPYAVGNGEGDIWVEVTNTGSSPMHINVYSRDNNTGKLAGIGVQECNIPVGQKVVVKFQNLDLNHKYYVGFHNLDVTTVVRGSVFIC